MDSIIEFGGLAFNVALWLFLGAVLVFYVILLLFTNDSSPSVKQGVCAYQLTPRQKEDFVRSKQREKKATLFLQGVLMITAAVAFAVLSFYAHQVFAMFCVCKAVADLYFFHKEVLV